MVAMSDFRELMERSYAFNQAEYDADMRWGLLEDMYKVNFLNSEDRNYDNMPKIIHQIWLGSEMPDKYKRWADTWKEFNPEWDYVLWRDSDVHNLNLPNMHVYNSMDNNGPKSDFLRYHILNMFGGMYIDTDFECLKSFDSLSYADFLIGVGYPSKLELYVGLIGCVPNHPIISQVANALNRIPPRGWSNVLEASSSYFFTRNFFKIVVGCMKGVVALPPDYFYPFPNSPGYATRNGRDYIKECSYAVHHWETAWRK